MEASDDRFDHAKSCCVSAQYLISNNSQRWTDICALPSQLERVWAAEVLLRQASELVSSYDAIVHKYRLDEQMAKEILVAVKKSNTGVSDTPKFLSVSPSTPTEIALQHQLHAIRLQISSRAELEKKTSNHIDEMNEYFTKCTIELRDAMEERRLRLDTMRPVFMMWLFGTIQKRDYQIESMRSAFQMWYDGSRVLIVTPEPVDQQHPNVVPDPLF